MIIVPVYLPYYKNLYYNCGIYHIIANVSKLYFFIMKYLIFFKVGMYYNKKA